MNEKMLVDEIVKRVSEKMLALGDRDAAQPCCSCQSQIGTGAERPRLLLLAREPSDLLGTYCHSEHLDGSWVLDCRFPHDLETLSFDELPTAPQVLVFNLTVADLADISSASPQSGYTRAILKAILNGSKIAVNQDGVELAKWEGSCPPCYYKVLSNKLHFLEKCGVVFTALASYMNVLSTAAPEVKQAAPLSASPGLGSKPAVIWDRRVLTESDLVRLLQDGQKVIAVSQRTILTDLAREFILRHGFELVRENS